MVKHVRISLRTHSHEITRMERRLSMSESHQIFDFDTRTEHKKVEHMKTRTHNIWVTRYLRNETYGTRICKYTLYGTRHTRFYWRVLGLILLLTASVKEDERGGQGHTSASLLHQSAT
jgi:hypothetical protein